MDNIAILGSKGTFSDSASKVYTETIKTEMNQRYYPTIDEVFYSVGKECAYGIVPVENTLDGYVQRSLDLLLEMDVHITKEITIPVQFSLISNTDDLCGIEKLYVQFKANGQCRKLIETLSNVKIITTEDNIASFDMAVKGIKGEAAIIPQHMYKLANTQFGVENITDSDNNFTRFLIIKPHSGTSNTEPFQKIKAAIYIMPKTDRPGILYEILASFSESNINLVSIMSRPTKKNMGTYNFYIELSGSHKDKPLIIKTLDKIKYNHNLKILGIYSV